MRFLFAVLSISTLGISAGAATPELRPQSCPSYIHIVDSSTADQVQSRHEDNVVDPSSLQSQLVQQAMLLLPPLQCEALVKVAFVTRGDDEDDTAVTGWNPKNSHQNLIYLNADRYTDSNLNTYPGYALEMEQTLIHEATHAAVKLLHSVIDADFPGILAFQADSTLWNATARQLAHEVINSTRTRAGVLQEWARMHDAFRAFGMTGNYYGNAWKETEASQAISDAFMSPYGGENTMEDMAEYASWPLIRHRFDGVPNADRQDYACTLMNEYDGIAIPPEYAAMVTKLGFLVDLQMLTTSAYESCLGSVGQGQRDVEPSQSALQVVTTEGRNVRRTLSDDVAAWMGRRAPSGNRFFYQMDAKGNFRIGTEEQGWRETPVHASIMIDLLPHTDDDVADISWPRGVYDLHRITPDGGSTRFIIEFEEEARETFWASSGRILVIRASSKRIQGTVVVLTGVRPMGGFELLNTALFHTTYFFTMKK